MFSDKHKTKHSLHSLSFLKRYDKEGDEFLSYNVTADVTSVAYYIPETTRQSGDWHHLNTPKKPQKFKQEATTREIMTTVFWDHNGILLIRLFAQRHDNKCLAVLWNLIKA